VTFGVRPEHLHRAGEDAVRSGLEPVTVTVDLIQPTGSRTYATLRLNDTEVMAELQAHEVERPGERLTLHVDMNRAIIIDPDTDLVL
jgi:multiple sugar transport system ATP-binding protein